MARTVLWQRHWATQLRKNTSLDYPRLPRYGKRERERDLCMWLWEEDVNHWYGIIGVAQWSGSVIHQRAIRCRCSVFPKLHTTWLCSLRINCHTNYQLTGRSSTTWCRPYASQHGTSSSSIGYAYHSQERYCHLTRPLHHLPRRRNTFHQPGTSFGKLHFCSLFIDPMG